jgi:lysophospholipase L1-like esterase
VVDEMIKTIVILVVLMNVQVVRYDTVQVQAVDTRPNIVLIGDSITDIRSSWHSNWDNFSYSDLLAKMWNTSYDVINSGVRGSTMKGLDIDRRITEYHPKYVIILYGTNDIAYYNDPDEFYNYYNANIDEIYRQNPYISIFLSNIMWTNGECRPESSVIEFNDRISLIASKRNIPLADLFSKFYKNSSLLVDGLHQNEKGARVIAETFNETFYRLFNSSEFEYTNKIQIEKRFNLNLNLNLRLNFNTEIEVEENVNYIPLIAVMFSILIVVSISVFLFEERKKIITILSGGEINEK